VVELEIPRIVNAVDVSQFGMPKYATLLTAMNSRIAKSIIGARRDAVVWSAVDPGRAFGGAPLMIWKSSRCRCRSFLEIHNNSSIHKFTWNILSFHHSFLDQRLL
jgi:hypothetical protein